jgi:hypothetical protein
MAGYSSEAPRDTNWLDHGEHRSLLARLKAQASLYEQSSRPHGSKLQGLA